MGIQVFNLCGGVPKAIHVSGSLVLHSVVTTAVGVVRVTLGRVRTTVALGGRVVHPYPGDSTTHPPRTTVVRYYRPLVCYSNGHDAVKLIKHLYPLFVSKGIGLAYKWSNNMLLYD